MKIIKIPYSKGGATFEVKGASKGPDKVVDQLKNIFLNESNKKLDYDVDEVKVSDNVQETNKNIYEKIKKENSCIIIGGDHSITYACFKAFAEKHKNPGLLIFDSHPDCYQRTQPPTHEDFVRTLVEEKIVKPQNIVLIGIRNPCTEEIEHIKQENIKVFFMKNLFNNIENTCDAVMESVRRFDALYLSIDIDVLDPAFAPGTGVPEPGGLTTRELLYFIQRIKNLKNLKMVDLVEVNPEFDINDITAKIGAKIIGELM